MYSAIQKTLGDRIAVEKLLDDGKNVLRLNPYLSFLHMLCFSSSGQNECQKTKVTG